MVAAGQTLLSRQDAAKHLGVDLRSLDRLIAAGEICSVQVGPRRVAIEPAELQNFIERRRRVKPRELLTPREASELVGLPSCVEPIGERDVLLLESAGFPKPVRMGGLTRYRRSEIEAWVAKHPDATVARVRHAGCGEDYFLCELRGRQWLRNEVTGEILPVEAMGGLRSTLKTQTNLG